MPYRENEIELRSDELQEVLEKKPAWILRFGITIIFFILTAIISLSFVVKYPDVLRGNLILTSYQPPISINARYSGPIYFNIKDQQNVTKGQILGYVKDDTSIEDFKYTDSLLKYSINKPLSTLKSIFLNAHLRTDLSLGDFQDEYFSFFRNVEQLKAFYSNEMENLNEKLYSKSIQNRTDISKSIERQEALLALSIKDLEKQYKTDQELYERRIISKEALDLSHQNILQKKISLENLSAGKIETLKEGYNMKYNLEKEKLSSRSRETDLLASLTSSLMQLNTAVNNWKTKSLLISPIDGRADILSLWSDGQLVTESQEIFKISPFSTNIFCKAFIPTSGAGKLKMGQKVNIKMHSYPYAEFGMLEGQVTFVSNVSIKGLYEINADLNQGMTTTSKFRMPYKPEMAGEVEVITKDLSVANRIFKMFNKLTQ